jgi:mRNA (2'-O-methyladenosine-N6-)-methyltransferase
MDTCKYVHYEMDAVANTDKTVARKNVTLAQKYRVQEDTMLWPAQWVQCDLRFFDMSVLGKFTVIMAGQRCTFVSNSFVLG